MLGVLLRSLLLLRGYAGRLFWGLQLAMGQQQSMEPFMLKKYFAAVHGVQPLEEHWVYSSLFLSQAATASIKLETGLNQTPRSKQILRL